MSEDISFSVKIENVKNEKDNLCFDIVGNDDYGLDLSIINAIRRIHINDIPTVSFYMSETLEKSDINIIENNSSVHNEYLSQRISLCPIYLNPLNYMYNHLFVLKVAHDDFSKPCKFVTLNDFEIYPLIDGIQERYDKMIHEDYEYSEKEIQVLKEQLSEIKLENYNMDKPLTQKEKDEIFRPYTMKTRDIGKSYILLIELKSTNTEGTHQNIHLYTSPSVGTGKEHARYQSVSQSTYEFIVNDTLFQDNLNHKLKLKTFEDDEEKEDFIRKFTLSHKERYFYKDKSNEPNRYRFSLKSCHYYDESSIFNLSIMILIEKLDSLKSEIILLLNNDNSRISIIDNTENVIKLNINEESHTIGNLIQRYITRYNIDEKSILSICGYNKPHPLEDRINMIMTLNRNNPKVNKASHNDRETILLSHIIEIIDQIISDIRKFHKVAEKAL